MKSLIKSIFNRLGYRIQNTRFELKQLSSGNNRILLDFDHVISKFILDKSGAGFNFIQVGAFDGVECDPLRKYLMRFDWRGVLLEPQPVAYNQLVREYGTNNNLKLINKALSDKIGEAELYILQGTDLPNWSIGMASFNKENILKHKDLIPNIESYIFKIRVETTTFSEVLNLFHEKSLDLLQVDTEGFDAEIIYLFPFDQIKPAIIHFESKHIPQKKLETLLDYLTLLGYRIARDGDEDMLAVL